MNLTILTTDEQRWSVNWPSIVRQPTFGQRRPTHKCSR
jgi:hypothetical protein